MARQRSRVRARGWNSYFVGFLRRTANENLDMASTDSGKPRQNGTAERFNSKF
jgi:hypothetical protein